MNNSFASFIAGLIVATVIAVPLYFKKVNELSSHINTLIKKSDQYHDENRKLTLSNQSLLTENAHLKKKKIKRLERSYSELIQKEKNSPLEKSYQLALTHIRNDDYQNAYKVLKEISKKNPKYKDVKHKMETVRLIVEDENKRRREAYVKASYEKAYGFQAKGNLEMAMKNYKKVLKYDPSYKDAKARLTKVNRQLQEAAERERQRMVKEMYEKGFEHQSKDEFAKAKLAFQFVVKYKPKYKDAKSRLDKVKKQLAEKRLLEAKLNPPPANLQTLQQPFQQTKVKDCFALGQKYGRCTQNALNGSGGGGCLDPAKLTIPPECKNKPEFTKGLQSAISQGSMSKVLEGF